MSLGGFKFAGYKISKDADGAWDAAWALKAHRARIKAFRSACELASSWGSDKWHYDSNWMSGDTTDGEPSPSSVIYYTDPSDFEGYGYNMITFYQWGSENKYFAIATFGYILGDGNDYYFNYDAQCRCFRGTGSRYYGITYMQLFHILSYDPFDSADFMRLNKTYPTRALSLYPTKGLNFVTTGANTVTPDKNSSNGLLYKSGLRFGYAIREKSITSIMSTSSWFSSAENKFDVTLLAFDSMNLLSPTDTANILEICPQNNSVNIVNANLSTDNSSSGIVTTACDTLKDNFDRYITTESTRQGSNLYITRAYKAIFSEVSQSIPFESVTLTASTNRTSSPLLNGDGITSKGTIELEYFATNACYAYTSVKPLWQTFANGNYLCVFVSLATGVLIQTNYYIGWDPSNPDITSEDAWTAYNG